MRRALLDSLSGLSLCACVITACVSDSGTTGPKQGDNGGPCYDNGTCNTGLVCVVPNKCVPQDGGTDAAPSADASGDGAPADAPADAPDDANVTPEASTCGGPNQPCCPLDTCQNGCCVGGSCTGAGSTCPNIGGTCNAGSCGSCGGLGQPCCSGAMCTAGALLCNGGVCQACGAPGTACCANNTCAPGHYCNNGGCI